jgi:hypothetical protein
MSSDRLRRLVAVVRTDVPEKDIVSVIEVERIRDLGATLE